VRSLSYFALASLGACALFGGIEGDYRHPPAVDGGAGGGSAGAGGNGAGGAVGGSSAWEWATVISAGGDVEVTSVVDGDEGVVYVAGNFSGDGLVVGTSGCDGHCDSAGAVDFFVGRIDRTGQVDWLRGFGGSGLDKAYSLAYSKDSGGTLVLVGEIGSAIEIVDSEELNVEGNRVGFIAYFDVVGTPLIAAEIGGGETDARDVAIGPSFEWVVGTTSEPGTLPDCSDMCSDTGDPGGSDDAYVIAIRRDGPCQFTCVFSSTDHDRGLTIAAAGSGAYVGGSTLGMMNFMTPIGHYDGSDGFIAHLDQSGTAVAALPVGGAGDDALLALASSQGMAIAVGSLSPAGTTFGMELVGSAPGYVVSLDQDLMHQWHHYVGNSAEAGDVRVGAVAANLDAIVVGGDFGDSDVDFDGLVRSPAGERDVFAVRTNREGADGRMAAVGASDEGAETTGVAITSDGNVVISGVFEGGLQSANQAVTCPSSATCGFVVDFGGL
jgi:hypothetical protein